MMVFVVYLMSLIKVYYPSIFGNYSEAIFLAFRNKSKDSKRTEEHSYDLEKLCWEEFLQKSKELRSLVALIFKSKLLMTL